MKATISALKRTADSRAYVRITQNGVNSVRAVFSEIYEFLTTKKNVTISDKRFPFSTKMEVNNHHHGLVEIDGMQICKHGLGALGLSTMNLDKIWVKIRNK